MRRLFYTLGGLFAAQALALLFLVAFRVSRTGLSDAGAGTVSAVLYVLLALSLGVFFFSLAHKRSHS
jgi:hypothetical protein